MPLRAELPEEGELVIGTVTSIRNFGAFVTLDEYGKREAFIHLSEVAAGWVKYIRDHIREGQKIVARVLRVDPSKNQIDLSLKRINDHQRREKVQGWKNEQRAMRLVDQVAAALGKKTEETTDLIGPPLIERYGSLFSAFEIARPTRSGSRRRTRSPPGRRRSSRSRGRTSSRPTSRSSGPSRSPTARRTGSTTSGPP